MSGQSSTAVPDIYVPISSPSTSYTPSVPPGSTFVPLPSVPAPSSGPYTGTAAYNPNSKEHSDALHAGRIVSNPPKVQNFLQTAESMLNKTSTSAGVTANQAWSAAFISDVAKQAGVSSVIPTTTSCTNMITSGVASGQGKWVAGSTKQPQVGDIAFFRTNSVNSSNKYQSDYCGVITELNGNKITVIQGNVSGQVKKKQYSVSNNTITGYYRPNWSGVDATYQASIAPRTQNNVYAGLVEKKDATMKEIGYIDSRYQPSIIPSGLKLSVINYSGLLSEDSTPISQTVVPETASPQQPSNLSVQIVSSQTSESVPSITTTSLSSVENAVVNYLIDKGLNIAVACGVCANIKAESSFRTGAVGDKGTSFGICQWHAGRGSAMKEMAGASWATNLTGQLDYLWYELCGKYRFVLNSLNLCPNTLDGAKQAADIFVRKFEVPANVDAASRRRQANAAEYWTKIVSQI